ncbi:MAG: DUF1501 domain-containing protein [Gemmataceae bacterium]|nr:DUF1501 domain-containing protein [Gemmataceae bacterium]
MLRIHDGGSRLCDGLTRREWLRAGGVGLLSLPTLLQARQDAAAAEARRPPGRARSCILLCLLGGPPQHETWDPKPDAPAEIRGPFHPIATSVPGLRVCELMPRTARLAHHCAILRAISTGDNAHSSSGYYMLTGQPHRPMNVENARPGAPNDWPSVGAVVRHLLRGNGATPSAITVPEHVWNTGNIPWPGQDAGWLGRTADPWLLHCDPSRPDFQVPALTLASDLPPLRFDGRRTLLDQVNRHFAAADRATAGIRYRDQYRQAFDLLRSSGARAAFEIGREPAAVRDRYGRHRFGQSLLLARRLVESGVPLVQVNWTRLAGKPNDGMWDTHARNAESLRSFLMPMMDEAFSALLEDLAQRGLLDETLVVWMGEFGRTPRHNGAAGRDHWGAVFSAALAGGGVRGGLVYGASDRIGAQPRDGRVRPEDLTATLFHSLGLSSDTEIRDPLGRPVPLSRGDVIRPILSA